ncbi:hypothetical protein XENORESO_003806 [Xenotaenia resolanae]|uniref:Uncharacterized protein n=1 Tax=Xenotaenia resolanae TaxID=208358 RepID=A0ABV0W517_9TELE
MFWHEEIPALKPLPVNPYESRSCLVIKTRAARFRVHAYECVCFVGLQERGGEGKIQHMSDEERDKKAARKQKREEDESLQRKEMRNGKEGAMREMVNIMGEEKRGAVLTRAVFVLPGAAGNSVIKPRKTEPYRPHPSTIILLSGDPDKTRRGLRLFFSCSSPHSLHSTVLDHVQLQTPCEMSSLHCTNTQRQFGEKAAHNIDYQHIPETLDLIRLLCALGSHCS